MLALDSRSIFLFIHTLQSHLVHFYLLPSIQDNLLSGSVWRQFYYSPKPIILRGDEEERRHIVQTTWQNPFSSSPFNVPAFLSLSSQHPLYKTEAGSCLAELPLWTIQSPTGILMPIQFLGTPEGLWRGAYSPLGVSGCPFSSLLLIWGQRLHDLVLVPFHSLNMFGLHLFSGDCVCH